MRRNPPSDWKNMQLPNFFTPIYDLTGRKTVRGFCKKIAFYHNTNLVAKIQSHQKDIGFIF